MEAAFLLAVLHGFDIRRNADARAVKSLRDRGLLNADYQLSEQGTELANWLNRVAEREMVRHPPL